MSGLTELLASDKVERSYKCFCLEQAIEALKQYHALTEDKEINTMRLALQRKLDAL